MAQRPIVSDFADVDAAITYGGQPAYGAILQQIARNLQHILCWSSVRIVGCQYQPTPDGTARATFHRWRMKHDWTNSRALLCRVAVLPNTADPSGTTPTFTIDGTASSYAYGLPGGSPTVPTDVREYAGSKALAPTAGDKEVVFGTTGSGRIVAVCCYQHLAAAQPAGFTLDDATYKLLDLGKFQPGAQVYWQDIDQIVDAIQNDANNIVQTARRQPAMWGVRGSGSADAISRTTATDANLFDQTITARDANSPGLMCPALYTGRADKTTVEYDVEAFAVNTGGATTATIKFQSSVDTVTLTVNSSTAQWWKATGLRLATNIEIDKVDILIAGDGTNPLRVWAVRLQENPA